MPERVLITGATGFVGSHIAEAFAEAGYEVRCGARDPNHPRWLVDLPVELVPLDLDHPADLLPALQSVDTVIHAAGITRARRPEDYERVNAVGTRRLAAAARGSGVRRFVFISSLAARGPDGMDRPTSAYGWSKRRAEAHVYALLGDMETTILRPAAVYGPRDTDLLPLFEMAKRGWLVLPSGPGLLQPVYAADVAAAALLAARGSYAGAGPFSVAEPASYSWEQVVRLMEKVMGRRIRALRLPAGAFALGGRIAERAAKLGGSAPSFDVRRAEDLAARAWTCDVSVTEEALGWRSEVPLREGLDLTARWYEKNGWT
ncbi:MAG: NAD(P)-dependent oxidoreductase [Actinomycetota bacterium]|nr:NAD(P)-dependent oxidoreductase [Actinomycetota bacterium]